MPRILKRDYTTSELIENLTQLVSKVVDESKLTYDTPSKTKVAIELATFRQMKRDYENKLRQENAAAQKGLF